MDGPTYPRQQQTFSKTGHLLDCFLCSKPGHRAAECKTKSTSVKKLEGERTQITCFNCTKPGHKANEYPELAKRHQKDDAGIKDKKNERKDARQRKIEEEQTITRMAPPNTLTGTVNGKETTLLLDTGAEISLIPEEWISNDRLDGRYGTVNGPGCIKRCKTAMIDFIVGTREYGERVALVPARELDNMGIIKVDLAIEEVREVLLELMKCSQGANYEEKAKTVRIVKTRVMARRDEAGEHISESGRCEKGGIAKVDSTEDIKGNENADERVVRMNHLQM